MKWIGAVTGILIAIILLAYVLLFTPFGNGILAPIAQKKINRELPLAVAIENFSLTTDSFAFTLAVGEHNRIEAAGNYELFSQRFNAAYRLRLDDLNALEPLTRQPLYGKVHADGKAEGTPDKILINGTGDIAGGITKYAVDLTKQKLSAVKLQMRAAKLSHMLEMVGKSPYTAADIALDIDISRFDSQIPEGIVLLKLTDGHIDTQRFKDDFNLTLPSTDYTFDALARLDGKTADYTATFDSVLAHLSCKGTLEPQSMAVDLSYNISAGELALFKPLTNSPLRGPLSANGTVKGDKKKMSIIGSSDIAASRTTYDVLLGAFKPQHVLAKISGAKLSKLLYMAGESPYATGDLDADITLDSLDVNDLKGHADISISKGRLVPATFKDNYGLNLPKTVFSYDLNARLEGKEIGFTTLFASNLATLAANGEVTPERLGMDLRYNMDIEQLELLMPLTDLPLRGPLTLSGTAKGDQKSLLLKGKSDLAGSRTAFSMDLVDLKPQNIKADIKGLQLGDALYMAGEPRYANGVLDIEADITGSLKGTIATVMTADGHLDPKVIEKAFGLKAMPRTTFRLNAVSTLDGDSIDTKADITSSLADLALKRAKYDIKKAILTSDYTLSIPDLERLYFLTERHLKGTLKVTGDLSKSKDLNLTAHSGTLGGTIDATVRNDDIHCDFKGVNTLQMLNMLLYPPVFASALDGTLDYNTQTQKGVFNATLREGAFTQNGMLDLLKKLARIDLYKESFGAVLKSTLDKERIVSDLDMRSRKSSIAGKGIMLNTKTQQVDAKLDIIANNHPIGVVLKGNIHDPGIKIDTKELIKEEAGKAVEKELNRLLKKLF